MIVVASNDSESSQATLPGFSIRVPVPAIRGLTRFLTMAEVAEVEDGVVIIDCVGIFNEECFLFLFSRFQELFLLDLISGWVDLPKGWTNVVYFSVKICEKFANYQNIKKTWTSGA